jgi:ParB-like chromosome segregation protein Spo0J
MKTKILHITQLLLDPENPRHDVIQNQKEIIGQLLETEKIDNLAKDIAEQGSLSPLESVGVIPLDNDGDEYIVLEGNRRICACILLNDPNLSPTDPIRDKFKAIKKNNKIPSKVDCIVFSSRDEADHWIQLRQKIQIFRP